jgi:hypothetical protein
VVVDVYFRYLVKSGGMMCVCCQLPLAGRLWVGGCGLARCLLSISDSVLSTPVNQRAAQRDGHLLPTLGLESAVDALGWTCFYLSRL